MKKLIILLVLVLTFVFVGCGKNDELNFGKELRKVDGMVDILVELDSGSSYVGVMDSVMAGYYIEQQYKDKLMIVPDLVLADEEYGIAARKDGAYTAKMISKTIIELANDGTVDQIAAKYGLTESLCIDKNATVDLTDETGKADWDEIVASGTLNVGYTVFAPIAYKEGNEFVGFDTDLARAVAAKLNLEINFVQIVWDKRVAELDTKNIDLIWNGMTITDAMKEVTSISIPYLKNKQVAVIRVEDKDVYKTIEDMMTAVIVTETGSAGQFCVEKSN